MITLGVKANEESTIVIDAELYDENDETVVPDEITWSLVDEDGTIINSREDIPLTPGLTHTIVISGDDLEIQTAEESKREVYRMVTVKATYTSTLGVGLPVTEEGMFILQNFRGVT